MTEARQFAKGIGQAVAERTITRKIIRNFADPKTLIPFEVPRRDDMALDAEVESFAKNAGYAITGYQVDFGDSHVVSGHIHASGKIDTETWSDVAERVALGNSMLEPRGEKFAEEERKKMLHHLQQASTLMSGRHLQHGDATQPTRNQEIFTNCSTSAMSFLTFYLLLNGSGVGRAYDDAMMVVDFNYMPIVVPVIDMMHKDVQSGEIESLDLRTAEHLYAGRKIVHFSVPDSREGWAKAMEKIEAMTFLKTERDTVLLLDFSKVRPRGAPIKGMQGRPASGPGTLMIAIRNVAQLRDAGMAPWRATMYADHYLAECVLVGGARRAARMATKSWRDKSVLDFIQVKRGGFLWSSNNSVTVDEEFWKLVKAEDKDLAWEPNETFELRDHAVAVFNAICEAAYFDGTGEPGLINVDKLVWNPEGVEILFDGNIAESQRFKLDGESAELTKALVKAWKDSKYKIIVNPCVPANTPILTRQGYVRIGDVVGSQIEVWNGREFSSVVPHSTGFNSTVLVELSDGSKLRCTPNHQFVLSGDRYTPEGKRVGATSLKVGDKLAKYVMPYIEHGIEYGDDKQAYSQGFYSGDGCTNMTYSWLYKPKYMCADRLVGAFGDEHPSSPRKTWKHGPMREKNWVPVDGSSQYCLGWLAGLLDSDGAVSIDKEGGKSLQISSIDKPFLEDVRLMLTRLGVQAKIKRTHKAAPKLMPDGRGGEKVYDCKECWRIIICGYDTWRLLNEYGLKLCRLDCAAQKPNRSASRFVTVVSVTADQPCETFCFTEPKNGTGTFNGIVTGQCGEIVLSSLGGYCVIADVVPFHAGSNLEEPTNCADLAARDAAWDDDAEDAFRVTTRALIRANLMDSLYSKEVKRTNRIGVGMTGIHEYAWARFGFGFRDIIDEEKSKDFWLTLSRFKRAVQEEAKLYSNSLGLAVPHTNTTVKPSGCASLDTAIKTTEGVLTMGELFAKHGVTEFDGIEDDTWIKPKVKTLVLDEGNAEREVTKLYINGIKPVYEIEFEDGIVVKLTGNHKLKTTSGEWKRVDELTEADEILQF